MRLPITLPLAAKFSPTAAAAAPHRGAKESAALLDLFAKVNANVRVKYYRIAGTFVNDKHGRQRRSKRDADRRGRLGVRVSGICSLYFAKLRFSEML